MNYEGMTVDEVFEKVIADESQPRCANPMVLTTYAGKNPSYPLRPEKTYVTISSKDRDIAILIGPPRPKPPTKIGGDRAPGKFVVYPFANLSKAKTAAFFSLKNSGFDRTAVLTNEQDIAPLSPRDIWESLFEPSGNVGHQAKAAFLTLMGVTTTGQSEFSTIMDAAQKVEKERAGSASKKSYSDNPTWGMF